MLDGKLFADRFPVGGVFVLDAPDEEVEEGAEDVVPTVSLMRVPVEMKPVAYSRLSEECWFVCAKFIIFAYQWHGLF